MKKILSLVVIALAFSAHAAERKKESEKRASWEEYEALTKQIGNGKPDLEKISQFLDNKANLSKYGDALLGFSTLSLNLNVVEMLLKRGIKIPDPTLNRLLSIFSVSQLPKERAKNYIPIIQLLLKHGADINYKEPSRNNRTPLMVFFDRITQLRLHRELSATTKARAEEIVNILIQKGSDLHAVNTLGDSVLDFAKGAGNNFADIIEKAIKMEQAEERWECDKNWRNINEENS